MFYFPEIHFTFIGKKIIIIKKRRFKMLSQSFCAKRKHAVKLLFNLTVSKGKK